MAISMLFSIFVFLLGAIVGSFLNVVILRYNTGMGIGGRSKCFSCSKIIRWFENIPVLSFALLRGRCSNCKAALSIQYPAIELATALTFTFVWLHLTPNSELLTPYTDLFAEVLMPALFYFITFSLLIIIAAYDLRHTIIPNAFVYSFSALALAGLVVSGLWQGIDTMFWLDLAAGPILFLPFWALWYFSGGTWMGFGDAKLALGIGWLLGLAHGVSAIVLGFWIGAAYAVCMMGAQWFLNRLNGSSAHGKGLTLKSEVPFGPFLIVGTLAAFLFGFDVFQLEVIIPFLIG